MAFAGLDIGTSSTKILVFDLDGNVIFQTSRGYKETGGEGLRELDPVVVTKALWEVLGETGENCPEKIEAMAVASLGESVVCLDAEGCPLANSMLTGDSRGITETEEIISRFGARKIFEITGLPPNELYGLPKYMWLNRNTEAVKNAAAILFYEDYAGYLLTGKRMVSYFSAARSMAFDIREKRWSEELLGLAGIKLSQMSQPVAPCTVIGTVLPEVAGELHLPPDMKIVVGGHDQTCAALGSGLQNMQRGECGMGTCEFMFLMLPEPKMSPTMLQHDFTCIPYVLPDTYLSSLEVTTSGILKNWARDTLFQEIEKNCVAQRKDFFAHMDELAGKVTTDVLLLPQFGSAGNPDLSMDAYGTITGLTIHTRPEEIYRALLEGMAFQLLLAYEKLQTAGTAMNHIVATGGGANSALTLQIRADVFQMPVLSLESEESGALGCMIMAAAGVGAYASVAEGIQRAVKIKERFEPNVEMRRYYLEKFNKYKKLYELMHNFR